MELRFNPKNRYDRTKQYRLVPDRLTGDLDQLRQVSRSAGAGRGARSAACIRPKMPNVCYQRVAGPLPSGKNTESRRG